MLLSNPGSDLRAPRLRVIANGQVIAGAMEAEVVSNNYYAADRFSASVALSIDQWAEASFWASEPDSAGRPVQSRRRCIVYQTGAGGR